MVVAAAALPADLRASFSRHVDSVNRNMHHTLQGIEQEEHRTSGASVAHGHAVLLVSFPLLLELFSHSHALLMAWCLVTCCGAVRRTCKHLGRQVRVAPDVSGGPLQLMLCK